ALIGAKSAGYLRKDDLDGNKIWEQLVANGTDSAVNDIAIGPGSAIYAVGSTGGNLDGNHPNNTHIDAFARKFDSAGDLAWTREFGAQGDVWDAALAAIVDGSNLVIAGNTNGDFAGTSKGQLDVMVQKYDTAGNSLFSKQLGTTTYDDVVDIAKDGTGS